MSASPLVTIFSSRHGDRINAAREMDLPEIERVIRSAPPAAAKDRLPLLKLAKFGDTLTAKNSYRHDTNVLAVTGIEGDYDGEGAPMQHAVDALTALGLAAILYTSASHNIVDPPHSNGGPRWRVICPLSRPLEGTEPELRERRRNLTGVLNAILGGILSAESFALSQSFYFGPIAGRPEPEIVRLDGVCLDELETPPAPVFPPKPAGASQRAHDGGVGPDRSRDLMRRVARDVRAGLADYEIIALHRAHPHAADQSDPDRAVMRCIDKVRAEIAGEGSAAVTGDAVPDAAAPEAQGSAGVDAITAGMEPDVRELVRSLKDTEIILPNDYVPFPFAARHLFRLLARRREAYVRNGVVLELNGQQLDVMTAAKLRSRIDSHGRRVLAVKTLNHGGVALLPKRCSGDNAEALLVTREAGEYLPPIAMVSPTAVLVARDGELVTLGAGYHDDGGGILVLGAQEPQTVGIDEAVRELLALTEEFRFASDADRSRAIAGFIGPALRAGGLLPGHAMMSCKEADESQTGKGYLVRVEQAIYGEHPVPLAKRGGGVGSLDEDIGAQLLRAKMFVVIDNVRGKLDSEYLEMILTADDEVPVRVPYRGQVTVSVRRMSFSLTSNGIVATRDLGNRLLITRLLKHRPERGFKKFPEGGLLEHVRARQAYYLGAVHAVIREWHEAGKPRMETEHSFREWVGALDWIVQGIFGLRPLLEGHAAAVERVGNPALGWLRAVALAVVKAHREGQMLSATELAEICADESIELPGFRDATSDDERRKQVGRLLGKCFDGNDELTVDTVHVKRWERDDPRRTGRNQRRYQFWRGDTRPGTAAWEDYGDA